MKKKNSFKETWLEKSFLDDYTYDASGLLKGSMGPPGWDVTGSAANAYPYGAYDYSDLYDYGYTPKEKVGIYNTQQKDLEEIKAEWLGALVRFNTRYYNMGLSVFNGPPTLSSVYDDPLKPSQSRMSDDDYDYLNHTGTVISVAEHTNYKGQWCVTVMWSDGMLSYENILDLQIIQPGNQRT